jgi:hypothetical protein
MTSKHIFIYCRYDDDDDDDAVDDNYDVDRSQEGRGGW